MKRPGIRTTEFWLVTYVLIVLTSWASMGLYPVEKAAEWMMGLVALYAFHRHNQKKANDKNNTLD